MSYRRLLTALLLAIPFCIVTVALAQQLGQNGQEQKPRPRIWVGGIEPEVTP